MPIHWAIALTFASQIWQAPSSLGGVLVDSLDVAMAVLLVSIAVRGLPQGPRRGRPVPHLALWVALAALLTAAYAASPVGQASMTDPVRIVYQSYRYALREVLLYPVCCLAVTSGVRFDAIVAAIVVIADVFSLMSWRQGYGGEWGTGPFSTKNGLGAALAVPVVFVAVDLLRGRLTWFNLVSVLVLARGALFASSRGAFVGMVVGVGVGWLLLVRGRVRTRLVAAVAFAVTIGLVAVAVQPELLERPMIARMLSSADLQQNTFVWRTTERWPHFFRRAMERPWFGWGEAVDLSLGPRVNTPHSGYLSLAVTRGLPVVAAYLLFAVLTLRNVWSVARRAEARDDRVRAAQIGGAVACILTHNIVDAVIVLPFVGGELWLCAAFAARLHAQLGARVAAVVPQEQPVVGRPGVVHVTRGSV
jgi:O-antigen ligase